MKKVLLTGILGCLSFAGFMHGDEIDLCPEFPTLFEKQIMSELNTGLQKNLALAIYSKKNLSLSRPIMLKKDLWKNIFILHTSSKMIETNKLEILHNEICMHFNAQLLEMKILKGDQVLILLNPNNEAISHIMEDWSQKQVGIYKNMGLRVRWDSMNELQKSQKILKLNPVGKTQ